MAKKICLLVGHGKSEKGGYDSGAVSRDGRFHEFRIAREIAKYAAEALHCDLMNYDGSLNLTQRINAVNRAQYDFIAEIHLNAGGGTGPEVFYYHGSPTGKRAADAICRTIAGEFGLRNRGAKVRMNRQGQDYFGIIRATRPCAILVETVFIDTAGDLEAVKTAAGQKACGLAIARGLREALNV